MTEERAETARARFRGPTDTVGARIVVRWRGSTRTVPFNYAASDTFAWAVSQTTGVAETDLRRVHGRRDDPDNRVYAVPT